MAGLKVPVFERQVGTQEGQALSVPAIRDNPAAFGGEVAKSLTGLGETGSRVTETLANHMMEREHQAQTAQVIQSDNQFRTDLQKSMFDTSVDDKGVPKGVFNRQGFQANGATEEFDRDFQARRQSMMDTMDTPYKKQRLGELMDENYPRLRELVAKHEGSQVRVGQASVVDGHNQLAIQNAPDYFGDSQGLLKSVETEATLKHGNMTANGIDPDKISAQLNDLSGKIILSSLRPTLHTNPEQAQSFFDRLNEDPRKPLDSSTQEKIQEIIDDSKKRFQSRQKEVLDVHFNESEAKVAGKMANGQLTLDELDNEWKGNVSDDFYKLTKVALNNKPGTEGTESAQSSKAVSLMEEFGHIAEAESDKKTAAIMKFRKDVMANSTKLQPDQFHQLLSWSDPNFVNQIKPKVGMIQAGIDFIVQHYQNFTTGKGVEGAVANFIKDAASASVKNEDIPAMAKKAVQPSAYKENPSLMGQPDLSNNVIDSKSGIKQVTNNTTNLKGQHTINQPSKFKVGDERKKGDITYVRGADGTWRPKQQPQH